MEKDKIGNLLISLYTLEMCNSFYCWAAKRDKSFINAWHDNMENSNITHFFDEDSKEEVSFQRSESRQLLKDYSRHVRNNLILQSFVYSYDNTKKYLKEIQDKHNPQNNATKILVELGKFEDKNIMQIFRNHIAHNDDSVEFPRYKYLPQTEMFMFAGDSGCGNGDGVMVTTDHLIKLTKFFNKYAESARSDNYGLAIHPAKIFDKNSSKISSSEKIQMFRLDNYHIVKPDKHQMIALDEMINRIKIGEYVPSSKYVYFYPHKDSSMNNAIKLLQLEVILDELYNNRVMNSQEFLSHIITQYGQKFSDLNTFNDICYLLYASLLFQICSSSPNSILQECVANIAPNVNMSKVRNSIMHGTYFFDRQNSLVFYDGRDKMEENLKFVTSFTFDEIRSIFNEYCKIKYPESDSALYNMGSSNIPYPHIVDFDKDILQ